MEVKKWLSKYSGNEEITLLDNCFLFYQLYIILWTIDDFKQDYPSYIVIACLIIHFFGIAILNELATFRLIPIQLKKIPVLQDIKRSVIKTIPVISIVVYWVSINYQFSILESDPNYIQLLFFFWIVLPIIYAQIIKGYFRQKNLNFFRLRNKILNGAHTIVTGILFMLPSFLK